MGECIDHPLHQLKANRLLGLDYTGNPAHACPIVCPCEMKDTRIIARLQGARALFVT
jgi:hypothetical protein